jgi:hypothetical protein
LAIVWDGIIKSSTLSPEESSSRYRLSDAARQYNWVRVIDILRAHPGLVNATSLDSESLFASLHQAAHGGAPAEVVAELTRLGAWRTLQNANGERPIDIAHRQKHRHLFDILEPVLKRHVPTGVLVKIQRHFHDVIVGRMEKFSVSPGLRLPELEPLLEQDSQDVWFSVPGMYGGFSYDFRADGSNTVLTSESWCRVVGGSGQTHEITIEGSKLVATGFV